MKNMPQEQAAAEIAQIIPALQQAGVKTVAARYDGEWDIGTINLVHLPALPEGLRTQMENRIDALLPSGWRLEYGSFGDVVIDIDRRTVAITHWWRVVHMKKEQQSYALF
jgi:hypothetical protein